MRGLRHMLGLDRQKQEEKSETQQRVETRIDELQDPKRRLEELLEAEPTGFVLGDAVTGRRDREQWTRSN